MDICQLQHLDKYHTCKYWCCKTLLYAVIYDAFISYSHAADDKLAPALQFGLHRFARPWYKMRALRIFRDTTNLSISPGLWPSIEHALGDSRYFILLASRESAVSRWVQREIGFWFTQRPSNTLLIVLTDGAIAWNNETGDFDWARTDAIPRILTKAFTEEPLYLDLRWIRADKMQDLSLNNAKFRDHIADLAATLHGRSKDDIIGQDVVQHRKTKRLAWSGGIALVLLTATSLVAAGAAVLQWMDATEQLATNYWSQAVNARKNDERLRASHFFAKAGKEFGALRSYVSSSSRFGIRKEKVPELHAQIRDSLLNVGVDSHETLLGHILQHEELILGAMFSYDDERILTWSADGTARLWRASDGTIVGQPMRHEEAVRGALLSPDVDRILSWSNDKSARLWRASDGAIVGQSMRHGEEVKGGIFSPDGRQIVTWGSDGTAQLWQAADGAMVGQPMRHEQGVKGAVFTQNGQKILTWSFDGTARLWQANNGMTLGKPMRH
ncbi:MAG: hypothetical protein AB7V39_09365, partial [Nitrospiraceae bacterium]